MGRVAKHGLSVPQETPPKPMPPAALPSARLRISLPDTEPHAWRYGVPQNVSRKTRPSFPSSFVAISPIKSMDAVVQNETIGTPANQMAVLFDKHESVIRKHINHVLGEGGVSRANNTHFCVLFVSMVALSCRRHGCGRGDGK